VLAHSAGWMCSDEELAAAAKNGDGDAFAELYRRYVVAITTYMRRRSPAPEIAFDLTAETFAAAVAGIGSFRVRRGSFRGWLFAIAANELHGAWRRGQVEDRARRKLALERVVLDDEAIARVEELVDDEALRLALAALPALQRAAVEARIVEEREYRDVAAQLGCSESVVRQRVSRGLKTMRSIVEKPS
jgi:RNA polymerase sigma factor (sigma-70 family)